MAWRILETGGLNMIRNLKYYVYRGCQALGPHIREMEDHLQRGKRAKSIEEMMGNEGLVRQTYYAGWREISPVLAITKRTKRPPADRINALISFCNGLVYSTCAHAIAQTHLDRTLSFVHAPTQARNSLALDLAEIFKPIIADRMIFSMVNKRILDDGCYEEHPGVCLLSRNGRERVLDEFRERMDNTRIGEEVGWRRIMVKEAFAVEAHVLGLAEYEPFVLKA
jgi:CRISPR-associated protein Cas1